MIDPRADRVDAHLASIERSQELRDHRNVLHTRIKPEVVRLAPSYRMKKLRNLTAKTRIMLSYKLQQLWRHTSATCRSSWNRSSRRSPEWRYIRSPGPKKHQRFLSFPSRQL